MDAIVDQLVLRRFLVDLGNLFDSVERLREGTCQVKQKGANWNQKGTKSEPKGDPKSSNIYKIDALDASTKSFKTHSPAKMFLGPSGRHLVDLGSHFGAHWISKGPQIRSFRIRST